MIPNLKDDQTFCRLDFLEDIGNITIALHYWSFCDSLGESHHFELTSLIPIVPADTAIGSVESDGQRVTPNRIQGHLQTHRTSDDGQTLKPYQKLPADRSANLRSAFSKTAVSEKC